VERRTISCTAFDGWVSRSDFRLGTHVWGQNGTVCSTVKYDTTLLYRRPGQALALASIREGSSTSATGDYWVISIGSECSWHYHKKTP
jgi:hypothetical protein